MYPYLCKWKQKSTCINETPPACTNEPRFACTDEALAVFPQHSAFSKAKQDQSQKHVPMCRSNRPPERV